VDNAECRSLRHSRNFTQIIIGLTLSLATPEDFTTLFVVIIFHRTYSVMLSEPAHSPSVQRCSRVLVWVRKPPVLVISSSCVDLAAGTRLAFLKLPPKWSWAPFAGALIYCCVTPIGMAIGLGTRESTVSDMT
jgi:zinc transporter 1/2/3